MFPSPFQGSSHATMCPSLGGLLRSRERLLSKREAQRPRAWWCWPVQGPTAAHFLGTACEGATPREPAGEQGTFEEGGTQCTQPAPGRSCTVGQSVKQHGTEDLPPEHPALLGLQPIPSFVEWVWLRSCCDLVRWEDMQNRHVHVGTHVTQ